MNDSERPKPLPARPVPPPAAEAPAAPPPAPAPPGPSPEPEEAEVSWGGRTWVARVLGKSGRAQARSAPLLLVGFWDPEAGGEGPTCESIVPGRRLADVPEEVLVQALARGKAPPVAGQRRPFFDDAEPTRRSAPGGEY